MYTALQNLKVEYKCKGRGQLCGQRYVIYHRDLTKKSINKIKI